MCWNATASVAMVGLGVVAVVITIRRDELYNPLSDLIGHGLEFPDYFVAVFVLPLIYGAWRFVSFHLAAGPVLAWVLTSNPDEMPAVWRLFSIGILQIGLSPSVRYSIVGAHRPVTAEA